jgi:biopolymer transport protein ExbD
LSAILIRAGAAALAIALSQAAIAEAPKMCRSTPTIYANGSVRFDGALYSDRSKLKSRLIVYRKRNSDCFMSVTQQRGTSFKAIGGLVMTMQEAGFDHIGFLTEPRSIP